MFATSINRAPLAVSAFAPGRVGMRPVPFIPALHSIVCKEYDQLHAAETAFLTFPVMKVGQPVIFRFHPVLRYVFLAAADPNGLFRSHRYRRLLRSYQLRTLSGYHKRYPDRPRHTYPDICIRFAKLWLHVVSGHYLFIFRICCLMQCSINSIPRMLSSFSFSL